MKIEMSYFVKKTDGTSVWLAVGKSIPEDQIAELEERPMLIPDLGKVLRHKETGAESAGHWLRNGDSADEWEEIPDDDNSDTSPVVLDAEKFGLFL